MGAEPQQTERVQLANQHLAAGRLDEAEKLCGEMLRDQPEFAPGLHLLAHIAATTGQDATAIAFLRRGIATCPDDPAMWTDLGFLLARIGQWEEALKALTQAVDLGPEVVEAWIHLADVRLAMGDPRGAASAYCHGVSLRPGEPAIYGRIAGNCDDAARIDAVFEECARIFKTSAAPRQDAGAWRESSGEEVECREEGEIGADAWFNLAFAAQLRGCVDVAIRGYREALRLKPGHLVARNNLGTALRDVGQVDAAIECFRMAADDLENGSTCHSNLLYLMHFQADVKPEQLLLEHAKWDEKYARAPFPGERGIAQGGGLRSQPLNDLAHGRLGRRLRIGYVSPNFFEHPVGRFLRPLFAHHDRSRFEIFVYSSVRKADHITARLEKSAEHWVEALDLSDAALAERIIADGIDILVDLTMHMREHRLLCFARKPAPIQVTYLAYCSTTGLKAIDYRLTDPYLDPPAEDERDHWYSERSVRLPKTYWCYEPGVATPEVNALPAISRGYVTFASLNNFSKASAATLSAWGRILDSTKNSRLLLHAHRGAHRHKLLATFAGWGIAGERIVFVDTVPMTDYFKLYHLVDIALDTFPYAGGTTTCDALWMGVPVVSLAGRAAFSRGGLSILSNVGHPELAAESIEQYVAKSIELAGDLRRLGEMRHLLRGAMQRSPVMDGAGFARDVEACFERMNHENRHERTCRDG
jgi:protein O-GlcNAc transferase